MSQSVTALTPATATPTKRASGVQCRTVTLNITSGRQTMRVKV